MQLKRLVVVLTLAQTSARLLAWQRLRGGAFALPAADLQLPDLQLPSSATPLTTRQAAGLEELSKVGEAEFDAAVSVLVKVLDNVIAQPDEARYRRLRTSNAKIRTLLATEGVRALLVGSGFVEEADALLNAEGANVATVRAGLEALLRLKASRAAAAQVAGPILRVRPPGDAAANFRPMWHAPSFRLAERGPQIRRRDVEGVEGAFVLSDVLSREEVARPLPLPLPLPLTLALAAALLLPLTLTLTLTLAVALPLARRAGGAHGGHGGAHGLRGGRGCGRGALECSGVVVLP